MKTTATAVAVALLSFVIGNIWVFLSAEMFVQYFYEARMVALTHVFTLGWVSLMIIGVLRQLATVAFGLKLKTPGDQQIVVFVCLLLGLAVSSAGVLLEDVFVFRLGWAMWLAGIIGFGVGIYRLATEIRRILRSQRAAWLPCQLIPNS